MRKCRGGNVAAESASNGPVHQASCNDWRSEVLVDDTSCALTVPIFNTAVIRIGIDRCKRIRKGSLDLQPIRRCATWRPSSTNSIPRLNGSETRNVARTWARAFRQGWLWVSDFAVVAAGSG